MDYSVSLGYLCFNISRDKLCSAPALEPKSCKVNNISDSFVHLSFPSFSITNKNVSCCATRKTPTQLGSMSRRSKTYGVASGHADEDTLPTTTQTSFFQKGREFESAYVNHKYTDQEKEQLATYESVDYLPPHSSVYKVCFKNVIIITLMIDIILKLLSYIYFRCELFNLNDFR